LSPPFLPTHFTFGGDDERIESTAGRARCGNGPNQAAFLSDARLKRDVSPVARLANGLMLYRYRYLWDGTEYVGVMAQEVADVRPDAVVYGNDGFMRVDYARLGLRMQTWDTWLMAH
jgi:hypothetical protein